MECLIVLGLNYSVITWWNHRDETVLFFLKYIGGCVGYGVKWHFQQHFSYIVGVSFIGGGNRRKPPTCLKSLIMLYRRHLAWEGIELTTLVMIGTDCIGSCKSNYHTITTTTSPLKYIANRMWTFKRFQKQFCIIQISVAIHSWQLALYSIIDKCCD